MGLWAGGRQQDSGAAAYGSPASSDITRALDILKFQQGSVSVAFEAALLLL